MSHGRGQSWVSLLTFHLVRDRVFDLLSYTPASHVWAPRADSQSFYGIRPRVKSHVLSKVMGAGPG